MRYCTNCGKELDDFVTICPDCNQRIPSQDDLIKPQAPPAYEPHYDPDRQYGRPTGITIVSVLIALGIIGNLSDGVTSLNLIPVYGISCLMFVIFRIFAIYGLWNMKTWGGNAAIALYCISIVVSAIMTFTMLDMFVEIAIQNTEVPYGFRIDEVATRQNIQNMLTMALLIEVVLGGIVIAYVNSKKEYFVN